MSSFSEASFVKKLADLNNSQQSIQTLSLWLIHHRKHSKTIVDVWLKEHKKGRPSKRLTYLYLANDIIQNSRKKGPEFHRDFKPILAEAFRASAKEVDEKTAGSIERLLTVWNERGIYDTAFIDDLKRTLKGDGKSISSSSSKNGGKAGSDTPSKTPTTPATSAAGTAAVAANTSADAGAAPQKKKRKVELTLREEVDAELAKGSPVEPPQPEELAKALLDLENSASSDAAVREKIAAFPPEVSDVTLIEKVTDRSAADRLAKTVEEACSLLTNYNSRLADELQERRRIARLLREFILLQKTLLAEDEKKVEEYKGKLDKVSGVRKELKAHLQSLPDIAQPSTISSLAPLPSAGDLFQ